MPVVSVILPVYNAEKFILESVNSILSQTFSDFELIIVNDGSTDNSQSVLEKISDPRVILINQENAGLAASLNRGLSIAKGEYIARQDNDDISFSQRLEKQVNFLKSNKHIDLVGTWAEIISEKGQATGRFHKHPSDPVGLKFHLLFNNPFVHSSVMFRGDVIAKTGNYSTDPSIFEDYNLWSRMARITGISNLPEVLLKYREVHSGMSKSATDYDARVKKQSMENISFYCPDLARKEVEKFVSPDQLINSLGHREALNKYNEMLERVFNGFCKTENINPASIAELVAARRLQFRRHVYNSIIYSSSASAIQKIKAAIARKIMFMTNKKYLYEA